MKDERGNEDYKNLTDGEVEEYEDKFDRFGRICELMADYIECEDKYILLDKYGMMEATLRGAQEDYIPIKYYWNFYQIFQEVTKFKMRK